jgi:3-methyladenine DNA glycosylase AlkD
MNAIYIRNELRNLSNPEIAAHSQQFFKTGKGEYGEGDRFLGIRVPEQRKIAKKYIDLPLDETEKLLQSEYHEDRLTALFILVNKFQKADFEIREKIFDLYLKNTHKINNWDLVDSSATVIVGDWLQGRSREIIYSLAESDSLWERRIAIMATFIFIRQNDFDDTLKIADLLMYDPHDLIHKATGWMLREVGKRDQSLLIKYLKARYANMPRTMLRYAIEKLPEPKRKAFLKGTI